MEAARIATLRGHKVTVFEKSGELGGADSVLLFGRGKTKMRWYADWLRGQLHRLGVEVRLRAVPACGDLKAFDAVVLATGGKVEPPGYFRRRPALGPDLRGRAALRA